MSQTEPTVIVTLELLKHSQQSAFRDGYYLARTQIINMMDAEIRRIEVLISNPDMTRIERNDYEARRETLLDMTDEIKTGRIT